MATIVRLALSLNPPVFRAIVMVKDQRDRALTTSDSVNVVPALLGRGVTSVPPVTSVSPTASHAVAIRQEYPILLAGHLANAKYGRYLGLYVRVWKF